MNSATPSGCPLVSFVLLAYNQEDYIAEAVEGAFAQTYQPLEIILSDDCSDDRTFEIIRDMAVKYTGPHKVRINRNDSNLGLIGHVNKAFSVAVGELIVAAAGDDVSLPERCECLHSLWEETGYQADGLCSAYYAVTPQGTSPMPAPPRLTVEEICQRGTANLLGATAGWSRRLIHTWGPIQPESLAEDQSLALRALLGGGVVAENQPLVRYRVALQQGIQGQGEWSARTVWRLRRRHRFFCLYLRDLDWWIQQDESRARDGQRYRRLLERGSRKTAADTRALGGGRGGVLVYCGRVLAGMTRFETSFFGRLKLVASLVRRRVLGRHQQPILDVSDHRALKDNDTYIDLAGK